jgi:hypothetical protein
VQGSLTRHDLVRRLVEVASLTAGLFVGGILLAAALWALDGLVEVALDTNVRRVAAACLLLLLAGGDVWAVWTNRLYPVTVRRQASHRLSFSLQTPWLVNFTWGVDAGFSVGTYRVTSGLWVMAGLVVLLAVEPWSALLYSTGFALGYLAIVLWPLKVTAENTVSDASLRRVANAARSRRIGQLAYLGVLSLAAADTLFALV